MHWYFLLHPGLTPSLPLTPISPSNRSNKDATIPIYGQRLFIANNLKNSLRRTPSPPAIAACAPRSVALYCVADRTLSDRPMCRC